MMVAQESPSYTAPNNFLTNHSH